MNKHIVCLVKIILKLIKKLTARLLGIEQFPMINELLSF